ncbi:type 2 isopentenyl-diphosphate Delta-isomerase [Chondromyces crocatus]|uniref:Isopentenyl-diphosphate delta-isomerase n=1 Tax=Chondromyces crocatus TaxID=52 RepID=A0A0K1EDP8_CHOCO|nr:type 2 isopentenyl-diphosphate Delta-isomerase [Chondromyces crocatus]AKT39000.1 isopentenyl pyrophosphate isomerase [Chondromyces crocatus]
MTDDGKYISGRKADHIELCATGDVGFRSKTTLLEEVGLVHDALPEMSLDAVDTSTLILGKRLRAPILIAAMTGGTERAQAINRELAQIAEERGYGFGLGSQRAMLNGATVATYEVRDVAPSTLVLGNIGVVQAKTLSTEAVAELVAQVGADALCVHLNPAMELVQPGGDRDFSGALETLERLAAELSVPVVAKETGCGIGPRTAARLVKAGVRHVDVSGAGGTSWVAVETARAAGSGRALGEALRDWGVPTAASVAIVRAARPRFRTIIATGGLSTGLDVARALALGADAGGIARAALQELVAGGREAVIRLLEQVENELRAVMLLVGARDLGMLRKTKIVCGPELRRWLKLARRRSKKG